MSHDWHPDTNRLHRRLVRLRTRIAALPEARVRDPWRGRVTVRQLQLRDDELYARILADVRAGSRLHCTVGDWQRRLAYALPALDALVAFWFLAGVLDVDLRRVDPTLAVAAGLSLMCTLTVAMWNGSTGRHLRAAKDHGGRLVRGALDETGRAMFAAAAGVWLLLAAMMYLRVSDEVYEATGRRGAGCVVIGAALAAALVLVNAHVVYTCFRDGSPQTCERRRIDRALTAHQRRLRRLRCREARLAVRLEACIRAHAWIDRTEAVPPGWPALPGPDRSRNGDVTVHQVRRGAR